MTIAPPRLLGTVIGVALFASLFLLVFFSVYQLATALLSIWMVFWVAFPVVLIPLALAILYRLIGLLTAQYHLDRDGFSVRWGLVFEQIPLSSVQQMQRAPLELGMRPPFGLWWPGCFVGHKEYEGIGPVDFFASRLGEGLVLVTFPQKTLAISPPDPEAFIMAFHSAARMGSLERIEEVSVRTDFVFSRLWSDWVARLMILLGGIVPIVMLGYLAIIAPTLPLEVPFGFDAFGTVDTLAPPGRLLLLPLIAGFCWMVDFTLGVWLYRRKEQRPLSYMLWGSAILMSALLWVATAQLVNAIG